ncbi:MAG: 4-hydroxythreonine-4-phosphate dehydrogenase PdxA [Bacteroidales bacterium]|nr:4-hydroxythreonine-4-phosphate dehydrogenase PdxA [Bacteroidales bacterium]MEE0910372.1 4-hydroxythreonine-4-phosphate dehydrogenase PdxA [Bacteroidales bacterium]MEE0936812.1 4-hydroxythreonine-4-phosphate dehydrogenase PdxA [Bacteroidales bacterium]MEE0947617.1 4-hydroxythreonine-4-phosphate dehydrogenase PdxA [Bacteroidales bacterium]MEE0961580.1 4-hydroxythreonine-4-phosphate dehydrogenase PdxA [Bacteroidales bacterium]
MEMNNSRRTPFRSRRERDNDNIRLGISQGDVNGIGYEVLLKCFSDTRMFENCTPILYGSSKVASYHKKLINATDFPFVNIRTVEQAETSKFNILNIIQDEVKLDIGQATEVGGRLAAMSLDYACHDLMQGKLDALVTNPINKKNIQSDKFNFPGHTEYLTNKFGVEESLMIMTCHDLHIGIMTNHLSLSQVPKVLDRELILRKLQVMDSSLKRDFGIRMPKIAVLALNPHAGDRGLIGTEDDSIVAPAIREAFDNGILAFGPYPADGFFGNGTFREFDGVMALYHDQGLIPFKLMSFTEGVNFTAGLPYVRTSPSHGTAYEIAGKNIASAQSFRNAVFLAMDIIRNRREFDALSANTLRAARRDNIVDEDITTELQKDDEPAI